MSMPSSVKSDVSASLVESHPHNVDISSATIEDGSIMPWSGPSGASCVRCHCHIVAGKPVIFVAAPNHTFDVLCLRCGENRLYARMQLLSIEGLAPVSIEGEES